MVDDVLAGPGIVGPGGGSVDDADPDGFRRGLGDGRRRRRHGGGDDEGHDEKEETAHAHQLA
jgi:hypothetical protein